MTLSNPELTRKVNKLTETLGYVQDHLETITVEQRAQGRRLGRVEKRLDAVEGRLDSIDTRLDTIDTRLGSIDARLDTVDGQLNEHSGLLQEILRRLPEPA
jgi:chromosome segregation ATPase